MQSKSRETRWYDIKMENFIFTLINHTKEEFYQLSRNLDLNKNIILIILLN